MVSASFLTGQSKQLMRATARSRNNQRFSLLLYSIGVMFLMLSSRSILRSILGSKSVAAQSLNPTPTATIWQGETPMPLANGSFGDSKPAIVFTDGNVNAAYANDAEAVDADAADNADAVARPCNGIVACISIHVFAYNRLEATKNLLETLESSDYSGYDKPVPLLIHLDKPAGGMDMTPYLALSQMLHEFKWTHGPRILDISKTHRGLKDSWLSAWKNPNPDDVMIAFEDDTVPSPHYFQWLLKILKEYELQVQGRRDASLLGISLSPMRVDEISYPFRPWMTHENVPATFPVYLHATPSSWGAAYFGGPWREFLAFVQVRSSQPFYNVDEASIDLTGYGWHTRRGDPNLWLPNSRSNNWIKSWKRFMVDFAYGRGAYMIYPNLGASAGLATSTFMQGEHVPVSATENPRIAPLVSASDLGLSIKLPAYDLLPLKDMHGQDVTRLELAQRGDDFLRKVSALGRKYSDVVTAWKRPCLLDTVSAPKSFDVLGARRSNVVGQEPMSARTRQLLVQPQMGFSNQQIAVMHSAIWAHVLQRTLVLPHIFWPRASNDFASPEAWVPFHEVFDASGVSRLLPGLELVHADYDVLVEWHPHRVVGIEPSPVFDRLHNVYVEAFDWTKEETVDLHPHRPVLRSIDRLYQTLGSCDDRIMVLDGLFKDPVTKNTPDAFWRRMWKEMFTPSPLAKHLTEMAQRTIIGNDISHQRASKFACLHVRQGDFSGVCSVPKNSAAWLERLYSAGLQCSVSTDTVVNRANSLGVDAVLIITDEPAKLAPIVSNIRAEKVWTGMDIQNLVKEVLPRIRPHPTQQMIDVFTALTEQHLCANADKVVLNGFSTFSRSVSYYRERGQDIEWW